MKRQGVFHKLQKEWSKNPRQVMSIRKTISATLPMRCANLDIVYIWPVQVE